MIFNHTVQTREGKTFPYVYTELRRELSSVRTLAQGLQTKGPSPSPAVEAKTTQKLDQILVFTDVYVFSEIASVLFDHCRKAGVFKVQPRPYFEGRVILSQKPDLLLL